MTSFTAKTLFVCFDFVFAAVFTLSTARTTTTAATEFTQVAAMAAPCNFLIHSKLTSLQASYTLATLCDWCVVSDCCRLFCELRYRCVQPTVLCYGRESSTCCIWIYPDEKRPAVDTTSVIDYCTSNRILPYNRLQVVHTFQRSACRVHSSAV